MKMTDQAERDYLQAELASGRVSLSEISDTVGLTTASAVIGGNFDDLVWPLSR